MDIRGLIVLIIATGIMALLIVGIVGAAFWGKSLTGAAVESLSTVLGMLIGIIASYVAGQYANRVPPPAPPAPVDAVKRPVDEPPVVSAMFSGDEKPDDRSGHETGSH